MRVESKHPNPLRNYLSPHYIHRSNWLRAAVLGANDGLLSTASIVIGVASASETSGPIVLAALASLVAGALSMASGEYVSVSSHTDIEKSDISREEKELAEQPETELQFLATIYEQRGLKKETALQVAKELTESNSLAAHMRDDLGINEISQAKPFQAALASGASFTCGAILPLIFSIILPLKNMVYYQYGLTIVFLMLLGAIAAKAGGSNIFKSVLRISLWGTVAMAVTAAAGSLFEIAV